MDRSVSPEMFEAFMTAFADTLVRNYRQRWNQETGPASIKTSVDAPAVSSASPWLRVAEAAKRAQCGTRVLYEAVRKGRLRAVRVNERRDLRLRAEWVDAWLEGRRAV